MEIPVPDRASRAELRRLVFTLRSGTRRRIFPPCVHIGDPDGDHEAFVLEEPLDAALRADVLHRMLDGLGDDELDLHHVAMWLTRVGWPEPHDLDRAWLATALRVFAERGSPPRWFAIVTKNGWYDALGRDRVIWKRLRIR
jgi:hypothetical protein